MIVSRLCGGLGNQLFQYAAARRLALRHDAELVLDASWYPVANDPDRAYSLDAFRVAARTIRDGWLTAHVVEAWRRALRFVGRAPAGLRLRYVPQRHFHFDPAILELGDDVFLDGYWQSERYFADVEPVIREELQLAAPLSAESGRLATHIAAGASASIHVRRGDYAAIPSTREFHGLCSPAYYDRAMRLIEEREPTVRYFVFSDEPDWAEAKLPLRRATVVRHNSRRPWEDLWLMSACDHHIVANSSFSWWGAWLGSRDDAVTVAPERWFAVDDLDTRDLLPPAWVRL